MPPVLRFAPSPTGLLHIGNARTALLNWFFAKKNGGRFILRFDDTDSERSRPEFAQAIEKDLHWLGITPDSVIAQSTRGTFYATAAAHLREKGLLYPCYETADELERHRKRQRARGLPPVYDRRALRQSAEERARFEAEGRRPHWRFLLPNFKDTPFEPQRTEVTWTDLCRGVQSIDLASLSDPVLVRADGSYLYTLPSLVDDIEMGVTHIVRGEDHVANTAVQIALFKTLGAAVPLFGHHNLLIAADGKGLSKRSGALSLKALREEGFEALTLAIMASLLGTSESIQPLSSLEVLQEKSDLGSISRASARFDPAELEALNARMLSTLPYAHFGQRLEEWGVSGGEEFWNSVRANIKKAPEVKTWWRCATERLTEDHLQWEALPNLEEGRRVLAEALKHFPPAPWDVTSWASWTQALGKATDLKGRGLFLPLRLALTGRSMGPDMASFLPFIGYERSLERLQRGLAFLQTCLEKN